MPASEPLCKQCNESPATLITTNLTPLCASCWFQRVAQRVLGSKRRWSELEELWRSQGGRCAYTGDTLAMGQNASLDHRVPRSQGGKNVRHNLQWVCKEVNQMKANLTHTEFLEWVRRIARRHPPHGNRK